MFHGFDKLKNKIQNSILRFVFTSIRKTKFKKLTTIFMFNGFLLWIFNALIRFSFSLKKWKTKNGSFFVFMKELKNELLKQIKIWLWLLSQVWSTRYSRSSSCQVPWGFPLCNGHTDTKNRLFRKQLMYFNVYIAGCYFHI